jgi:hypothetical protein
VVVTPWGVTLRMVALAGSATYRLPASSAAIPCGRLKRAAEPVPSCAPPQVPQTVAGDREQAGRALRPVGPAGPVGMVGPEVVRAGVEADEDTDVGAAGGQQGCAEQGGHAGQQP